MPATTDFVDDLVSRLVVELGWVPSREVFARVMPPRNGGSPAVQSVLRAYGSLPPSYTFDDADEWQGNETQRVQFMARAMTYDDALNAANAAYNVLQFTHQMIGTTRYIRCDALNSPYGLGKDENGCELVVFNVEIER